MCKFWCPDGQARVEHATFGLQLGIFWVGSQVRDHQYHCRACRVRGLPTAIHMHHYFSRAFKAWWARELQISTRMQCGCFLARLWHDGQGNCRLQFTCIAKAFWHGLNIRTISLKILLNALAIRTVALFTCWTSVLLRADLKLHHGRVQHRVHVPKVCQEHIPLTNGTHSTEREQIKYSHNKYLFPRLETQCDVA